MKLVATGGYFNTVNGPVYGGIFVSTNSGGTWTQTSALTTQEWNSVASSADGTKLVASGGDSGTIYTSTNSGTTWIPNNIPGGYWRSVASSADGNKLFAVGNGVWISQTTPAPMVNLGVSGYKLVLSWTLPSMSFTLQQNPDLRTTNWVAITNTPSLNPTNLQYQVTLAPSNSQAYYRLTCP